MNVLSWLPVFFPTPSGPGKESDTIRERFGRWLAKVLRNIWSFCNRKVGVLPIPDLGNKLDDCVFRLERLTGQTLAGAMARKTKINVYDSSAQTKPDDQVEEFEIAEDFDYAPSVRTASSRPWPIQGKVHSICQNRDVSSKLTRVWNDQYSTLPSRTDRILMTFLTEFCRRKFVGGCCSEARGGRPQERAAIVSATRSDTSCSNVSEKLRSQWSDADLAQHDGHGNRKSHDGNRESHDWRLGIANLVDLSDVNDVDDRGHEIDTRTTC